jgi:hypothetical protein
MRTSSLLLALGAGLALAACNSVTAPSGPPIAGSTAGPGAPPLQQQTRDIAGSNSGQASPGTAEITGVRGQGRPAIEYTGTPSGTLGSSTPQTPPEMRQRSRP